MTFFAMWAAMEQNPWLLVLVALMGVCGGLVTNRRRDSTGEGQLAIDGLTNLTTVLQAEVNRLSTRITYLSVRVVHLEDRLREAGLPVPEEH